MSYKIITPLLIFLGIILVGGSEFYSAIESPASSVTTTTPGASGDTLMFQTQQGSTSSPSSLPETQTNSNAPSIPSTSSSNYVGNGFSITIPSGWEESASLEKNWQSTNSVEAKVWGKGSTFTGISEIDVVWTPDTSKSLLNTSQAGDSQGFDANSIVTHPPILGATNTLLVYENQVFTDSPYTVHLYAHGNGNVYEIIGTSPAGSVEQASAIKNIILSFKLN